MACRSTRSHARSIRLGTCTSCRAEATRSFRRRSFATTAGRASLGDFTRQVRSCSSRHRRPFPESRVSLACSTGWSWWRRGSPVPSAHVFAEVSSAPRRTPPRAAVRSSARAVQPGRRWVVPVVGVAAAAAIAVTLGRMYLTRPQPSVAAVLRRDSAAGSHSVVSANPVIDSSPPLVVANPADLNGAASSGVSNAPAYTRTEPSRCRSPYTGNVSRLEIGNGSARPAPWDGAVVTSSANGARITVPLSPAERVHAAAESLTVDRPFCDRRRRP